MENDTAADPASGQSAPPPVGMPPALADHPLQAGLGAAALGLIGAVLLAISAQQDRLWWVVLWFVLGIALVALTLLYLNDVLAERLDSLPAIPARWWIGFGACSAIGAGGLLWLVVIERLPVAATFFVLATAVGLVGLYVGATRHNRLQERLEPLEPAPTTDDGEPRDADDVLADLADLADLPRAVGRTTQFGIGLMTLTVVFVTFRDGFDRASWLAVLVWIVGLIMLKIGVIRFLKTRRGRMTPTTITNLVIAVIGVISIYLGAVWSTKLLVLVGLSAVIGGLSVLGLAVLHCECSPMQSTWLLVGGVVAIVAVTWWVVTIVNGFGLGVVLSAFVWGIGTWYVFRGEGIVLVLLLGYIAVWGLVDRTADVEADPHDGAPVRVLALGDSFISGEGANEYLAGTNQVGRDRNECRRAPTAYPYVVADQLGYSLDFVACSGAKARDLTRCGQMVEGDDRCRDSSADWVAGPGDGPAGHKPQLLNFTPEELQEFDVVLLSIGGNDVGFSTIVQACLLPRGCEERREIWLANVEQLGPTLVEAYEAITTRVPATTPVIVMPYPMLVTDEACGLGLSEPEHEFVVEFITALDDRIEAAAASAGVNYFEPSETAFDGVQLCDDPAGANHLLLSPPSGDAAQRYQPGAWIHNSMHPNELGHERIAERLAPFMSELVADVAAGGSANPAPTSADVEPGMSAGEEDAAEEAVELLSDDDWITTELYRTVRALALPLALLLAAGMVLAVGIVRKDFPLLRILRPRNAPT